MFSLDKFNHMFIVSPCESMSTFSCLNIVFLLVLLCCLSKRNIMQSIVQWNVYAKLFVWLNRKHLRHIYLLGFLKKKKFILLVISVRLSGFLAFRLGIDKILFTQFHNQEIQLMMHPYNILVVFQSKNNFALYLISCMDINQLLVQIYESQS